MPEVALVVRAHCLSAEFAARAILLGCLWWSFGLGSGVLAQYRFDVLNTDSGLPQNSVYSILQTRDGYLWFTTLDGLVRYNGAQFTVFNKANTKGIKSNRFRCLYEDTDGTLWIGTDDGGVTRYRGGQFKTYSTADGLPHNLVDRIRRRRDGDLVILTAGGLARWRGEKFEVISTDGLSINLSPGIEGPSGNTWYRLNWELQRVKDGKTTTFRVPSKSKGLTLLDNFYEDRAGRLWKGTIGLGTIDNGLMRMTPRVLTTVSEQDGLTGKIFYPIIEDHIGAVWIGNVGVNQFKDGKATYYPLNLSLQNVRSRLFTSSITSLYEDRQGRLWIAHGLGLYRYEHGQFFDDRQMITRGEAYAIYQDTGGAFWFGFMETLTRYQASDKNAASKTFTKADGLDGFVQPIYEDRQGRIWIGSYGGLAQYVDGRLVMRTEKDGLSSNRVRALYEDSDGVLWIGTYDGGLNRFKDGRFTQYTMKEGMFSNGVFAILEDQRGNFWMSSNQGIYRARKQQLNDFAAGKVYRIDTVAYGKADGMLNTECNGARQPAGIKTRDGRLWFPTFDGVAVVNPAAVTFNSVPPPVVIEHVILDRAELDQRAPLEVKPGQDNLEIHYAGLSFIKPESMQFKYKLEGLDHAWVEAGNRRVAYYSHLPAGSYTFRVSAANSDGVWNNEGQSLRLSVLPPFYRTWWFMTLALLGAAGLVLAVFRYRVTQLQRQHQQQQAFSRQLIASQEAERKRIAAELHDSLGQRLVVIKNLALIHLSAFNGNGAARAQIEEISTEASQAIGEVKEISYNLRPYQLDRIGLTKAVEAIVKKAAAASEITFTACGPAV